MSLSILKIKFFSMLVVEKEEGAVAEVRGIQLNLNDIDNNAESPKW